MEAFREKHGISTLIHMVNHRPRERGCGGIHFCGIPGDFTGDAADFRRKRAMGYFFSFFLWKSGKAIFFDNLCYNIRSVELCAFLDSGPLRRSRVE